LAAAASATNASTLKGDRRTGALAVQSGPRLAAATIGMDTACWLAPGSFVAGCTAALAVLVAADAARWRIWH
jgi:hypothetical protein